MRDHYLHGAHVEVARYTERAANYCKKEDKYFEIDNRKLKKPSGGGGVSKSLGVTFDTVVKEIVEGCSLKHIVTAYPSIYVRKFAGIHKLLMYYQRQDRPQPEVIWCCGGTGTGKSRWIKKEVRPGDVYWHSGTYHW